MADRARCTSSIGLDEDSVRDVELDARASAMLKSYTAREARHGFKRATVEDRPELDPSI